MPRESKTKKRERAAQIVERLAREYAAAECALTHRNALELLVATILSAQCTDERVNIVTKDLFRRCKTARDYAEIDLDELKSIIRSTGFYNNKAKNIHGMARRLLTDFDGKVPQTMDELLTLPGVARKTASVVLGTWYGKAEGIVVDTHVKRISRLLGLTTETNPDKVERDLMAVLPDDPQTWIDFSHRLIHHGRAVCVARRPRCPQCVLADLCPSAGKAG